MCGDILCFYENIRGLRTKVDKLNVASLSQNYDILALTETWLNSDFNDYELLDNRYAIFREDRDYNLAGCARGGGVLFAVKKNIACRKNV